MTIEEQFKEIRDNLAVAAAIQARHEEIVAFHDEWLREQAVAIAHAREQADRDRAEAIKRGRTLDEHMAALRIEADERDKALGERVDKLVSAIGEICRRIPLPPEAQ